MPDHTNEARLVPGVVVQADDPLTRDGTAAFLAAHERVRLLSDDQLAEADILVMLTATVSGKTLSAMSRASQSTGGRIRVVLVADHISEQQLALAVNHGLASFLVRPFTSFTQIVTAAVEAYQVRSVVPPTLMNVLLDRMRTMQKNESPVGLLPVELAHGEVDVLRLLAEGLDTVEIANKLRNCGQSQVSNSPIILRAGSRGPGTAAGRGRAQLPVRPGRNGPARPSRPCRRTDAEVTPPPCSGCSIP